MGLRLIWDFTNAHDDDGTPIDRDVLIKEFAPDDETIAAMREQYGLVITVEET